MGFSVLKFGTGLKMFAIYVYKAYFLGTRKEVVFRFSKNVLFTRLNIQVLTTILGTAVRLLQNRSLKSVWQIFIKSA